MSSQTRREPRAGIVVLAGICQRWGVARASPSQRPETSAAASVGLNSSTNGSASPALSVMGASGAGTTSLIQTGGKGAREARTAFAMPGVTRLGALVVVAAQLAGRRVSWEGSINCNEGPQPSALVDHGARSR